METLLDRIGLPIDETGDPDRIHMWTGLIALVLLAYVVGIKITFGTRAL